MFTLNKCDNMVWINLAPTWLSNHIPSDVWDEITYPFLNFNGASLMQMKYHCNVFNLMLHFKASFTLVSKFPSVYLVHKFGVVGLVPKVLSTSQ